MAINTTYKVTKGTPESLLSLNRINDQDLPLVQRLELDTVFKPSQNRLDVFFYSLDGRYLSSKIDSRTYSVVRGGSRNAGQIEDITLNPEKDSIDAGYPNGDVNVLYNFVNNLLAVNNTQPKLFIESISPDRTEIRALTNDVSRKNIVRFVDTIKGRLNDNSYFEDFRLNFGRNQLLIGININRVEYSNSQAILIKLYEPLPAGINVKDTFLLEELVGDSVLYQVVTEISQTTDEDSLALRGPNYDIELIEENNNPTGYLNYNELFSYPVSNSYYEVYSLFNERGAQISIDHTNFEDFIQFSSAEERLRNFYYKVSLLESYRNQIDSRAVYTASLVENIQGIVNNFDHYDRYLYYETGSWSWPKSSSTRPFELYSTGSTEVQNWYTSILLSASNYDASNQDRLINSIPSFIRDDANNASYSLFTDMIGQHFDNLWIYSKAVTDKFDADNRLDFGISKDLVRDAIENFGIKLYNNNEALENLFAAFTGETYNTGSEQLRSLIVAVEGSGSLSGSAGNEYLQPMPKESYQKEVYKRIYHNIPLLLKSKGTERGLRALINSFGIPSDILKIKTFGGQDTTSSTFFGPSSEVTSSLGKIRIANTDTVVTGSTLSNYTSVVNLGGDYSKDLHTVEIGFSPADNLDTFIKSHPSMSVFDIDSYIGDPGYAYSGSYSGLSTLAETVFTSGSAYTGVYNAFDFVRLIKFFDNSIFRIIKDFVPARSNIDTGIIIKPHLLNRSKIKQPQVGWSNQSSPSFTHTGTQLDYTGSYYSTNFSIDGEIDTAFVTGSAGLGIIDSASFSYTETYANPSGGYQTLTRNNHDQAAYTGELSGSIITTTTGDLTVGNTFRKLEPELFSFKYIPRNDFTANASVVASVGNRLSIVGATGGVTSPTQNETGTPIEVTISDSDDYFVDFTILGGPNNIGGYPGGYPTADSASHTFFSDELLEDGETLLINVTATFGSAGYTSAYPDADGGGTKLILEILSGSTVVDTATLERTNPLTPNYEIKTATLSYTNNTGASLDGYTSDFSYRVKYSSNYNSIYSQNFIDASVSFDPKKLIFDDDAITVWLSEDTTANYTASILQALTVPLNSTTNGSMLEYVREAKEVVFQYPSYVPTGHYNNTLLTSSIEGGSYRASITIEDNDINLTHVTSAPYSGSFTQALPDLNPGENIQFNFTVDFDSYWSTYLNTYNVVNTPFVTASIRNRSTGTVTGSLSYSIQQGQYPNEYKRSLKYENDTGGTLSDLEFYYQVNIPKADKGAGNPRVNLKNISVEYRVPTVVFNNSKVLSSQKLRDTFYIDIDPNVEVYSGSLSYFVPSADYYKVGFVTGESELFKFNDYASTSNNIDSLRKSNIRLKVDEKTYSPTQGTYRGFFLPGNFSIISSSIANGVEGLDERFFAEVQDSNYSSVGWRNGRYDGTELTNIKQGTSVLGEEPALTYNTFNSSKFPDTGTTAEIKSIYSGSEDKTGDLEVYYTTYRVGSELSDGYTYHSNKEYVSQTDISSYAFDDIGPANVVTATATDFEVNTSAGAASVVARYSGSLGSANTADNYIVSFRYIFTDVGGGDSRFNVALVNIGNGNTIEYVSQSIDANYDNTVRNFQARFTADADYTEVGIRINADVDVQTTGDEAVDIGFNNITIQKVVPSSSDLLPFTYFDDIILSSGTYQKTKFFEKVQPTPSNPTGYQAVVSSKIYRFDNSTVYTTNDKGIVTNIE